MKRRDHLISIPYTSNDDGVHLFCPCGWEKNIGFGASTSDIKVAESEHLAAVDSSEGKEIDALRDALETAINSVECASICLQTGEELPWYRKAKKALGR